MTDWTPVDLLPGLWLGLVGTFLAAVLRRWYDPVPGRVLTVFVAALLALFAPVLFGGKILLPLDSLREHVPFQDLPPTRSHGNPSQADLIQLVTPSQAAVQAALEAGRWPLWNRLAGAGMPLLADPQAQALQPLTLLGLPLPPPRAAGFVAALRVLVALIFTFLWLRRQGLGGGPALAGSLAYGLGFLIFWAGWPAANLAALLPVALYAVARCDGGEKEGGGRDAFLLVVAVLGLLLGGDPGATVCALGLLLLYFLDRARRRPAGTRRALLARAGAALLVAAAVSAPVILPTLRYLPEAVAPWSLVSWRSWRSLLPFSLCLAFLVAWALERFRRREVRRWRVAAIAAGLGALLAWADLAAPANPPMPLRLAFPQTDSLRALRYALALRASRGFHMAALGDVLPPNLAGLYGMADVRIYNPLAPKAYVEFTKPITTGWRGESPELGAPDDPLYQRLGVRYLLTTLEAQLAPPWGRIFVDRTVAVWEQPEPLPLFFLATRNPAGGVLTSTIEDTWISGSAHLRRRQWLGTSVYQDGGWLLLIDGRRHRTVLDSGTFVATRLPPGTMRLDLLYRPAEFVWGWAIAALGVVAGGMVFVSRPSPALPTVPTTPASPPLSAAPR